MTLRHTLRRGASAAITVAGAAAALAPAAQAGPFLAPQRLIDPVLEANPLDLAVGPGGAAAVAFQATTKIQNDVRLDPRVWVAVHEQGSAPSASLPRGFKLAEPVSPAGVPVVAADVGIDAAGNMTVAYTVGDLPLGASVYTRYRPAGGTWGPEQRVSFQGGGPLSVPGTTPELVVAPDGRAILLTEAGLFDRAPGATRFTAVPDTAAVRHVAMNPAGNVAAVVLGPDNGDSTQSISVRTRSVGRSFGLPKSLGLLKVGRAPDTVDRSSVAITDSGNVVVAWQQGVPAPTTYTGPPYGLNVSVRTPGSTFPTGTWTTTLNVGASGKDQATLLASGTKVAVRWTETRVVAGNSVSSRREQLFPGSAPSVVVPNRQPSAPRSEAISPAAGGRAITLFSPDASAIGAFVRPTSAAPFGAPQTVIAPTGSDSYDQPEVEFDDQGNGYVSWWLFRFPAPTPGSRATFVIGVTGYDPVAPVLTGVTASAAKAGQPVAFSATATDRMSVPKITWTFGDGTTGTGAAVSHTYATAGTYTAKASAKDEAGNSTSSAKTIVVAAP